jgi:hypothetical protein
MYSLEGFLALVVCLSRAPNKGLSIPSHLVYLTYHIKQVVMTSIIPTQVKYLNLARMPAALTGSVEHRPYNTQVAKS